MPLWTVGSLLPPARLAVAPPISSWPRGVGWRLHVGLYAVAAAANGVKLEAAGNGAPSPRLGSLGPPMEKGV